MSDFQCIFPTTFCVMIVFDLLIISSPSHLIFFTPNLSPSDFSTSARGSSAVSWGRIWPIVLLDSIPSERTITYQMLCCCQAFQLARIKTRKIVAVHTFHLNLQFNYSTLLILIKFKFFLVFTKTTPPEIYDFLKNRTSLF